MAGAIARKQQWVADQARAGAFSALGKGAGWKEHADALLALRGPRGNDRDA